MKRNWQFKRAVNQVFYYLKAYPKFVRVLITVTFFFRFILRMMSSPKPDNIGTVIICDDLKTVYAGNPKVASSSVRSFFQSLPFNYQLETRQSYADVLQANAKLSDYYQFAFVRDPWSRVYSCWNDKISNNGKFADIFIISRYRGLYPDMPFAEFVHWLASEEGGDQFADRHWISQSKILVNHNNVIAFEYLGHLSSMAQDFTNIQTELALQSVTLPHTNQYQQDEGDYLRAYNKELLDIVSSRYQADIKTFGFELPKIA